MSCDATDAGAATADGGSDGSRAAAGLGAANECAAIEADLERLKSLFNDAGDRLMVSFNEFSELALQLARSPEERRRIESALGAAVTALQFQDMATQLTGHAQRRLAALQECLGSLSEDVRAMCAHPQPVHQAEMSAGSIDLY